MQRFKYFLTFFDSRNNWFVSYIALAQTKTQDQPVVVSAVAPVYAAVICAIKLARRLLC